ncbi:MAG: peptidoglycan DD-metalloendopeptidase family protein [Candidatus Gracilibacteria bacterium]|nr:peptidoglycan DD-metalloendopeptidase family protein [Candidatus Gracilibacteria bacterium]
MYPYSLQENSFPIFPIFGYQSRGTPLTLDYSVPEFQNIDPRNMENMNRYNQELLMNNNASWSLGGYLEDRSHILNGTHIQKEGRIYHLGIDILFPAGTSLYNPLDGAIYERGYESGDGNYGGYIIMRYSVSGSEFYGLYGHLSVDSITGRDFIKKGEKFAELGEASENGNWFPHLHLQVFTGKDLDIWKSKGYCKGEDIARMKYFCPDPSFLLRY